MTDETRRKIEAMSPEQAKQIGHRMGKGTDLNDVLRLRNQYEFFPFTDTPAPAGEIDENKMRAMLPETQYMYVGPVRAMADEFERVLRKRLAADIAAGRRS